MAYLAIADENGVVGIPAIMTWVGCEEREAVALTDELRALGLIRVAADLFYAPAIYEGRVPTERNGRRIPTLEMRRFVMDRDGHTCRYCGMTEGPMHIDHVLPHSRGGATALDNLVVACAPCNLKKRTRTPEEMGWRVG